MDNDNIRLIGEDTKADRLLNKYFIPNLYNAFIEISDFNYCMPITFKNWMKGIREFQVREDDTFIMGFPRSGTTWIQEMVWLIINDLDFEGAKQLERQRIPILENNALQESNPVKNSDISLLIHNDVLLNLTAQKTPRCIKTHLPWTLLPEEITNGCINCKIIYIVRDPKDVCISYYNLYRLFFAYPGSFEDFCTLFLGGRVIYGPYWESVCSFLKQKDRKNILFLSYKAMKSDLNGAIKKVANFLGKTLTEKQIEQLIDHLDIAKMRKNPAVNKQSELDTVAYFTNLMVNNSNNFIGKGEQNGYLSVMSSDLINRFNEWSKKHLERADLTADQLQNLNI